MNKWSIILLISLCSSGAHPLSAQGSGSNDSGIVTVHVLSPSPTACFGQSEIPFEAVITNNTDSKITVSGKGVGGFYFEKLQDGKVVASQNGIADVTPGKWILILPHQSAVVPFSWKIAPGTISSSGLFDSPGAFSAEFGFRIVTRNGRNAFVPHGSVQTNKVLFMISDCAKEDKPAQPHH